MEFETRTQLQDFAEGRDGEIAIFGCESEFGFFLGLEHNGFITYIHPFADTEAPRSKRGVPLQSSFARV